MIAFLDSADPYVHGSGWSVGRSTLSCLLGGRRPPHPDSSPPSHAAVIPFPPAIATPERLDSDGVPGVGELIGGKFRITESLGQGGMGVVLGGEHVDLRQAVAIKVMRPALAKEPDALARFLREARAAASIKSRHAVRIHDVGTTGAGVPYMVMERLHGIGVDALLAEQGMLAIPQAVQIIMGAAEAIAEANGLGIVHRDVKPSNLFLADDPAGSPVVKVLDFGISKRVTVEDGRDSASLTAPQTLLGSPQYMSPEQLRDPRSVDERTDVWGLGVTLYELVTGRMPFECDSIPELCALIFNSTPARADTLRRQVPAGLSDVIELCLVKRPQDRLASAAALIAKLEPFGRDGVAEEESRTLPAAREGGQGSRTLAERRPRRAPLLVAGAAASAVALGAALYVASGTGTRGVATPPQRPLASSMVEEPPADGRLATSAAAASAASAASGASSLPAPGRLPEYADGGGPAPSVATARRIPPTPSSPAPAPPPRPRGLKGIKLLD